MRSAILLPALLFAALAFTPFARPAVAQAPPSGYGVPTIDPSEIRPGMTGHGYSVFGGTAIERFDVEVLGVLHGAISDMEMILCRISGKNLEFSGVVSGMSGSPIYLDGKLAGALAYGWSWPKEAITGVTPIKYMLELLKEPADLPPDFYEPPPGWSGNDGGPDGGAKTGRIAPKDGRYQGAGLPEDGFLVPLAPPLSFSGFSPSTVQWAEEKIERLGLHPMQGASGGAGVGDEGFPLEAGGVVAVPLMRGDFNADVTGTVTWRDGDDLLAFGHPFMDAGTVRFPMAGGVIHTIMSRLSSSFKVSSSGKIDGAIVMDRLPAIRGDFKETAEMVACEAVVRNKAAGIERTFRFETVRHAFFTPLMIAMAVMEALDKSGVANGESARAKAVFDLEFENAPPVRFSNTYDYAGSPMDIDAIDRTFTLLTARRAPLKLKRFRAELEVEPGFFSGHLQSARVLNDKIVPGGPLRLNVTLNLPNREAIDRQVTFDVPPYTAPGRYRLSLQGGEGLESLRQSPPQTYEQFVEALADWTPNDALVIALAEERSGIGVEGVDLMGLPDSVQGVMVREKGPGPMPILTFERAVVPMDVTVGGSLEMTVEIEEEER